MTTQAMVRARRGSQDTRDGTSAPTSWISIGCRPVRAAGPSTPQSAAFVIAHRTPRLPSRQGSRRPHIGGLLSTALAVLAAATAVLDWFPWPLGRRWPQRR
jgi:hypothetical protein